jgi:hypothetical protein
LAYPYDGNAPDTTIEVDDATGRRMVRDGRARHAEVGPDSTGADLRAYAERIGADTTGRRTKADLLAAIQRAEQTRASAVTVRSPVPPADAT